MKLTNDSLRGLFGIEIEEHRYDLQRQSLSRNQHHPALGDRKTQPYFQTDFSESMEELVTAPHDTIQATYHQLHNLQAILQSKLTKNEIIWPFSMPPKLNPDDETYLNNTFERYWYAEYRKTLIAKYGLFQHIMCGIHFSYSPSDAIIAAFQKEQQIADSQVAKNQLLFKIAKNIVGYKWLLTYLFGAAPKDLNPDDDLPENIKNKTVKSFRASDFGFTNKSNINVTYDNFADFQANIKHHIENGDLFAKSEFYGPVRLKSLSDDDENRIDYLEFRMLDNNPFSQNGLDIRTLYFIHLLIIASISSDIEWTKAELDAHTHINNQIALGNPSAKLPERYAELAQQLMQQLAQINQQLQVPEFTKTIAWVNAMLADPHETISGKLAKAGNELELGEKLGLKYKQQFAKDNSFLDVPKNFQKLYEQALTHGYHIINLTDDQIELQHNDTQKTFTASDAFKPF
ncbi:glutamate--cysteine ligase [Fructilactobacillus sp. Tb1]|uniref:glutamate--cysteine ligase n=1 Tax=Fructilactobacillus sp. Tb1 TaxID=3422304 RepID=UPI003D2A84DF